MASNSQKAVANIERPERASDSGKRMPDFNIRVCVKKATRTTQAVWVTVGAMWSAKMADGSMGWTIKFNQFPPAFLSEGDALAMVPLPPRPRDWDDA